LNALPQPPFSNQHLGRRSPVLRFHHSRWKRFLKWFAVVSTVIIVLPVIAIVILLHSARFHTYVLQTAEQKASAALGSAVRLNNFAISWHGGPGIDLSGVSVAGAPPHIAPMLFEAESLRVQVTISSFLHRSWYVEDLQLEHPVVRIIADRQGVTNLPKMKSSDSQQSTGVFDLGVRHLALDQGEIYYNNEKSDITAMCMN